MGRFGVGHRAFGLGISSHFPLPELPAVAEPGPLDLEVSLADAPVVVAAFSGPADPPAVHEVELADGRISRTERGRWGDHLIAYGDRARLHLSADGRRLSCWAADVDDPAWRRFLLDTGLGTAALVHGYEAFHAGAVEHAVGVVAIAAGEGGGKSTLVAEFLRRGNALFCDDVLCVSRRAGEVVAHPGPPLMNLPTSPPYERILAQVDGEFWVAVDNAATMARPLAAFVVLARGGDDPCVVEHLPASPAPLLAHSLSSGRDAERLARRFAVCADLATSVPLLRLRAPVGVSPARLADALERALERTPAATGSAA